MEREGGTYAVNGELPTEKAGILGALGGVTSSLDIFLCVHR